MRSVAIDTNLLILLIVGAASPGFIPHHKRTKQFTIEDYVSLRDLVDAAGEVILTTHVLTETSNLLVGGARPHMLGPIGEKLAQVILSATERFTEARTLIASPVFGRLELTDAGLLELAKAGVTLLTVDLALYLEALPVNQATVNFTHLQEAARA